MEKGEGSLADETDPQALLAEVAVRADVPVDVISRLLGLESDFPDFTIYGSKTEFARRVARILDEASAAEGADA